MKDCGDSPSQQSLQEGKDSLELYDSEYRHLLDSLARFYNSQITAHVAYLITFTFGYFAVFSVVLTSKWIVEPLVTFLLFIVAGIVYFLGSFLPLPRYQLARVQLYQALSEIVWKHLGLTTPSKKFFEQLKNRALRLGIQTAVIRMFEATLLVSFCKKDEQKYDRLKQDNRWKRRDYFDLEEFYAKEFTIENGYEKRKILKIFDLTKLLWIAYDRQLKPYLECEKTTEAYKIGELFSIFSYVRRRVKENSRKRRHLVFLPKHLNYILDAYNETIKTILKEI